MILCEIVSFDDAASSVAQFRGFRLMITTVVSRSQHLYNRQNILARIKTSSLNAALIGSRTFSQYAPSPSPGWKLTFLLINLPDLFAKRSSHAFPANQSSGVLFRGNHYRNWSRYYFLFSILATCLYIRERHTVKQDEGLKEQDGREKQVGCNTSL